MINVNKLENRRVVQLSNQTIVPITYVPDIILYVDGIPYMRYDGTHDIQSIKTFIVDIYQRLQKTAFLDAKKATSKQDGGRGGRGEQQNQSSGQGYPQNNRMQTSGQRPPLPNVQQQQTQNITEKRTNNTIPAYTIGRPKCSGERDDVCYVSFNEAYTSPNQGSGAPEGSRQQASSVFYQQQQVH
jgi:hypothetical protein